MRTHNPTTPSTKLHFQILPDRQSASKVAAQSLINALQLSSDPLLCVAAGSSPARTYDLLSEAAPQYPSIFRTLRIVQVDEWLGLPPNDPATCAADLQHHLIAPLQIDPARFLRFYSDTTQPDTDCERMTHWLAQYGPIDVCVLGVGTNGHLAMNEPAPTLHTNVHVAELTEVSRSHPLLANHPIKPTHGITLGIADLLLSKKILLLAFGESKRSVLNRLRNPIIDPHFPVSFLHLHPNVTVLCDEAAATPTTQT